MKQYQIVLILFLILLLVLSILIYSKVKKCQKTNDNSKLKNTMNNLIGNMRNRMKLKSTNACAYIGGQLDNTYNCGEWLQSYRLGKECVSQDGSKTMPCIGPPDNPGPLNCCSYICDGGDGTINSILSLKTNETCEDPNN